MTSGLLQWGLAPVGADVVDEVVDAPPAVSPVRAVGGRVSLLSESTDEVVRAAEEAGWEVVAPNRFRRGGPSCVTGMYGEDVDPTGIAVQAMTITGAAVFVAFSDVLDSATQQTEDSVTRS